MILTTDGIDRAEGVRPQKTRRVFLIGDSIAIHYAPWLERFLGPDFVLETKAGRYEALRNLDHPRGMNCGDSAMVLEFLRTLDLDQNNQPDILVLNCGLHDIKTTSDSSVRQVSLEQFRANLQNIRALLETAIARFLWVRITPVDERLHNSRSATMWRFERDVEAYNAVADDVFAGCPVADLHGLTTRCAAPWFCDHVHFTEPVRAIQGAFLAGCVASLGAVTGQRADF